ncbi:MAG: pyrroline-5-carboxylate reductase [Oscillospiraceae bacterium]|nr:pyrroline-5-carboxylate reductase [Oscillospiraceae bacterium]
MKLLGFIGIGNMGGAIAASACKAVNAAEILVSAAHSEKAAAFSEKYGTAPSTNLEIAAQAKYVVLGVKPQYMEEVLAELRPVLAKREDVILVTMAAGLTMQNISDMAGGNFPVIRIMPNTPSLIGEGVIVYDANELVSQSDLDTYLATLAPAGIVDRIPEQTIDAASAISGSGPAFTYLFLEALADGAVACGVPRAKAFEYGAQTLIGSAKLFLESDCHPAELKEAVCSPGGSTMQGLRALAAGGMRSAVMEAVIATYEKNLTFIK